MLEWMLDAKPAKDSGFERSKICETLCESLSCLSLHFETKRFLAAEENVLFHFLEINSVLYILNIHFLLFLHF